MVKLEDITTEIMLGDFTNEQLNDISRAVQYRRSQLVKQVKRGIYVGSKVKFHSSKRNQTMVGTVEKVAVKFVTVNCGNSRWRVPANMMEYV